MDEPTGRRSIRLAGYDYRQAGAYFLTLCTHERKPLFGAVADGDVQLNSMGVLVRSLWTDIPAHYAGIELDAFVIMPNHLHGIVVLAGRGSISLPALVQRFKSLSTNRCGAAMSQSYAGAAGKLWQRNYYEHVIRNDADLARIRRYIAENPACWSEDPENPSRRS